MIIAVTGWRGRLGSYLVKKGCVPFRARIDQVDKVIAEVARVKPDVIINCAAWTDVDAAEREDTWEEVMAINFQAVANFRQAFDGYLVHISTGYVFDGKEPPYAEDALCKPVNSYGLSKYAGEQCALALGAPTLVVRTLDLFTPSDHDDKVKAIISKLRAGSEFTLPNNLYTQPTYVPWLVESILFCVKRGFTGVLHLAGLDSMTKYEFGIAVAKKFRYDKKLMVPTTYQKIGAERPLNPRLITARASNYGVSQQFFEDALDSLANERDDLHHDRQSV